MGDITALPHIGGLQNMRPAHLTRDQFLFLWVGQTEYCIVSDASCTPKTQLITTENSQSMLFR